MQTPNLDRLAAEGVRFDRAVCATPFCAPTRASWVTGQWPHTHGLMTNVDGDAHWLTDERANLPNLLHDAGYVCSHFGKWHLGHENDLRAYAHLPPQRERVRPYNQRLGRELKLDVSKIPQPRAGARPDARSAAQRSIANACAWRPPLATGRSQPSPHSPRGER